MPSCWSCHWGWPKPVADIYFEALRRLNGDDSPLKFSGSHVVWEDENFGSAESCLESFEKYRGDYSEEELAIARWSLEELAKLPLEVRCIEPDDYDGENPELFHPDVEVVKV